MALDNIISVEFTDEELKKINDGLAMIEEVMRTKSVNLSPDERQQYGRIANRNQLLVDKCKSYMEMNPATMPPTLNKTEFDKDYNARNQIATPLKRLDILQTMFTDLKTLLDFDNFNAAVSYYRYIKFLSSQSEAGATAIYKDLKKHYQFRPKSSTEEGIPSAGEGKTSAADE